MLGLVMILARAFDEMTASEYLSPSCFFVDMNDNGMNG